MQTAEPSRRPLRKPPTVKKIDKDNFRSNEAATKRPDAQPNP